MKFYTDNYFKTLLLTCLTLLISITMTSQTIFRDASSFIPQSNISGTDTVDSDLVDIDGDGDLDIFIAEGTASIEGRANRLLLNDGSGQFTDVSESNLPFSPRPANSLSADFADFDKDGDLDIVVANLGPTQLLLNNGNGIFTDASRNLLPSPPANIFDDISTEVAFEDVNQDGRLDIFVTNEIPPIPDIGPGGSQNFLYIQNEDGTFTDESLLRLPNVKNQSASFVFGDIDSDGDNDLIVANVGQNQILINDGNGFFTTETEPRIASQTTTSRAITLVDIDGDQDLDLVVSNSNLEQNQLFINNALGFFEENTTNALPVQNDTSSDVKVFDFNYDGHPDIIFANSIPNPAGPIGGGHPLAPAPNTLYINNGSGVFTDTSSDFLPEGIGISFDIDIADVNGDRLEDILISNANDGEEKLLLRDITPPTLFRNIIPFVNCITDNNDRTYTASFGYNNFNDTPVYIPESSRNKLYPSQIDTAIDQPVVFLPGMIEEAYVVTFSRNVIWRVNAKIAYASRRTPICDEELLVESTNPSISNITSYPNPFSNTATIDYTLTNTNAITIKLYNQLGKEIKTIEDSYIKKGNHQLQIDGYSLQLKPGIYYYKISSGKDTIVKSIIFKG
ncbi:T9SS type A sorting domain-containing protein [Aquimarina sp. MMG016]|uniref:T9SS type A sorting domain-containing protein n=1 Tax=Aquimarina sp. MMG016 TaxID=2822690 RepID=UPI001B3A5C93|nr:T9SS type A sorting domain-containing protein [Aquimarina sp. MMG016]MBQ4821678.1 T9SS type A sorting domain-containing protein [Aquimarina sp. MMG016]